MNKPRLIDANELKKQYTGSFVNAFGVKAAEMFVSVINQMPTAYDIDNVVERIVEANCYVEDGNGHAGHFVFTDDAIEIVKGGAE